MHNSENNSPLNAYGRTCIFSSWLNKKTKPKKQKLEEVSAVRFHAVIWLPVLAEKKASNGILALW